MRKLRMPTLPTTWPALDTIKARLYDLIPHRKIDPTKAVGFVAKAVKQIERTEKRVESQRRAAVRAVGRARSVRDAEDAAINAQLVLLHKRREVVHQSMKTKHEAAFKKQDELVAVGGKLHSAKSFLTAIGSGDEATVYKVKVR